MGHNLSPRENTVLQLGLMPNTQQATQMMTRLLVQHVKRTLTIAESGTLVPCSTTYTYLTVTVLPVEYSSQLSTRNEKRMEYFCAHLHNLLLDPLTLTTPDFQEPNLNVAYSSSSSILWRHRTSLLTTDNIHSRWCGSGRKIVCHELISPVTSHSCRGELNIQWAMS